MAAQPDLFRAELPGDALHEHLRGLRRDGPVVPVRFAGQPAQIVLGHELLGLCFKDEEVFPAGPQYARTIEPIQGRTFQSMDGPEHRLYRRLTTPAFKSRAVSSWEESGLAPLAHELVDRIAGDGRADLFASFTQRFPFLVISRMLGVPREAEEAFYGWATGMLALDPRAAAEFTETLRPHLAARRREPRNDVLSELAHTEAEGRGLTDDEILSHVRLLFAAGATTTHDGLGSMLYAVLSRPGLAERLRAEPERLEAAVEELLRWETPVANLPRLAVRDTELAGVPVPAGSTVVFSISYANRDPAVFAEPDHFDPDRDARRKLSFGLGSHSCPGLHLARKEIRVGTQVLLERLPGLVLADEPAARPRGGVLRGPRALPVRF